MACNLAPSRLSSKAAFKSGMVAPRISRAAVSSRATRVTVEARAKAPAVGIFGTKAGMMSYFTSDGLCVPATVIALEEGNIVTAVKTEETDGYNAVQVGYKVVPERKVTKPELGHLNKAGCPPMKHLREFRLREKKAVEGFQPGQALDIASMFKEGDLVDVAGTSIGKGFQGTIKRHNHKRGNMTHGSKSHREHGSIGSATTPSRVFPGLKMAGRMGNERVVSRRQQVLKVDLEKKAIVIKGVAPGKPGNLLELTTAKIVGTNW